MLNNSILFYITLIVVFESVAQTCLKNYSNSNNLNFLYTGLFFYLGVAWFLCQSYNQQGGLGKVNLIWSGVSILASLAIGILVFKEKYHLHDILATLMITSGILILRFTE